MDNDIRWEQRYSNFTKALEQLGKFINRDQLNELERQGLVQAFEYTYELAWKTLQDYLKHTGFTDVVGPKPVIRESYQSGYIQDGDGWMRMLEARNLSSHTYNEEIADRVISGIRNEYINLFYQLQDTLVKKKNNNS